MPDFKTHKLSIDRSRPGIWTVSINNPPINMLPSTSKLLGLASVSPIEPEFRKATNLSPAIGTSSSR
jgi:hypothetical protein